MPSEKHPTGRVVNCNGGRRGMDRGNGSVGSWDGYWLARMSIG